MIISRNRDDVIYKVLIKVRSAAFFPPFFCTLTALKSLRKESFSALSHNTDRPSDISSHGAGQIRVLTEMYANFISFSFNVRQFADSRKPKRFWAIIETSVYLFRREDVSLQRKRLLQNRLLEVDLYVLFKKI